MHASAVIQVLREALPGLEIVDLESNDTPTIGIGRDDLLTVFKTLRDHQSLQFALLVELTAVDRLPASPRFEIVYHLACLGAAYKTADVAAPPARLRVKVPLPGDDARIQTLTSLYPAAGWPEREVFDLFGVLFDGHPDLRRILTPEDWEGYPLRKDYPVQIRKDTAAWSPIQLTAEEFAANIRAERERATKQFEQGTPGRPGHAD